MSGEAIQIEYQRTPDDMARFCAKVYYKNTGTVSRFKHTLFRNLRGMLIGMPLVFGVLFLLMVGYGQSLSDFVTLSLLIITAPFIWVLWGACLLVSVLPALFKCESCVYRRCKKSFGAGESLGKPSVYYCKKTLTISAESVTEESEYGRSELFWKAFSGVETLDGFLCFMIGGLDSGYIVPDRYFASAEEKQRVYAQCVAWFEAAREKPAEGMA